MSRAREFADLAGSADVGGISGSNILHNGAMQVAQRGTSTTGITTGTYAGPDRIKTQPSGLGTWTVEQSTDAPDGFSNSYKMTCTTADSSPAAPDYIQLRIPIEGQDVQHLDYGSSGALATTISFYVKSSKTGTFTYVLRTFDGGAGTRLFSKNVTISSANTWEYKTVTAPGDASGAINNDNTMGLDVSFWLNSGSSFSGGSEQTTWANQSNNDKYLGTIDLGNAANETFQITGIKLEIGEKATPFEHRSYADELRRCQRYYAVKGNTEGSSKYFGQALQVWSTTSVYGILAQYPATMRAVPTVSQSGTFGAYTATSGAGNFNTSIQNFFGTSEGWGTGGWTGSSLVVGDASVMFAGDGAELRADAEL